MTADLNRMQAVPAVRPSKFGITVRAVYGCLATLLLPPILLLLFDAATWAGALAGLVALAVLVWPICAAWSRFRCRRGTRRMRAVIPALLASVIILLGLWGLYKQRSQPERRDGRVRSVYPRGRSFSPWDLVPEADQIRLGANLSFADPWIDWQQSRRLRSLMATAYDAIAADPELAPLGSVLNETYTDLLGFEHRSGQLYDIRPKEPNPRAPLILFVHGNVGGFKAYLWFWKQVSNETGARIVAPNFGNGQWHRPGGVAAIEAARAYALSDSRPSSIILAGLSNGGRGVSRAALAKPQFYDRLLFISPIMEPEVLLDPAFLKAWRGRPLRVIHGAQDRRIPLKGLEKIKDELQQKGVGATLRVFDREDHFLLLSSPEELQGDLRRWLASPFGK